MPTSKSFLPDVNVWLALASRRHAHHRFAAEWFEAVDDDCAAFCRVTQMGLLRLLTNNTVMGAETLTQAKAWQVYERMRGDARVVFLEEPAGLEPDWRTLTQLSRPATSLWTDGYLLAFARRHDLCLVTFDRGLGKRGGGRCISLGQP